VDLPLIEVHAPLLEVLVLTLRRREGSRGNERLPYWDIMIGLLR